MAINKIVVGFPPPKQAKGIPLLSQNRQFQWFSNRTILYPPVMASAATYLKSKGYETIYKDAIAEGLSYHEWLAFLRQEQPDILLFETKTPLVKQHWASIADFKKAAPGVKVIMVGDHVTALPQESMLNCPQLDFIISGGDYDLVLGDLVDHLKGECEMPSGMWFRDGDSIQNSGTYMPTRSLDELPFIDREMTNWQLYEEFNIKRKPFTYTMAGRDCPWGKCAFCSWTTIYPRFRVRSVENYLDEVGILIEKHGIKEIFDDTGTFPGGAWLRSFCEGMIKRGYNKKVIISCNFRFDYIKDDIALLMKEAGFRLLKFGLESANQETLDRLNKGTTVDDIERGCRLAKKAGLEVHITIMVGFPWETRAMAQNTLTLAKKLMSKGHADLLQSTLVVPYPGTLLHKQCIENDWFVIDPYDYERYDMSQAILKTPDMSPDEVMQVCHSIYKTFWTPGFILNHLRRIRSVKDVWYLMRGAKAALGHLLDFSGKRR